MFVKASIPPPRSFYVGRYLSRAPGCPGCGGEWSGGAAPHPLYRFARVLPGFAWCTTSRKHFASLMTVLR